MSDLLTDDRLREIKERCEKATKGPWVWRGHYLMQDCLNAYGFPEDGPWNTPHGTPIVDDGSACEEYAPVIDIDGPDAHFIAHARTDIPDLLAEVARLSKLATKRLKVMNINDGLITRLHAEVERLRGLAEAAAKTFYPTGAKVRTFKYVTTLTEEMVEFKKHLSAYVLSSYAALTESEGDDVHEDAVVQSLIDGYDDLYDNDMHCGKD